MSDYVKILTGKCDYKNDKPAFIFNTTSDDFQKHGYKSIDNDENVLVTAHTGCGKTRVGIYAIAKYIRDGKTVIYTTPLKALSNQKYKELKEEFLPEFERQSGIQATIGIMTGDNKICPEANCVVMTTEILRNSLYRLGKENDTRKQSELKDEHVNNIGCVIFDEVHYINDADRGSVWEETFCLLNKNVTLVLLSATIDEAHKFAEWIGKLKQKPMNLIPTQHRVIPLTHYIYTNEKLIQIMNNKNVFDNCAYDMILKQKNTKSPSKNINGLIKYLNKKNLLQCIFFVFSRKNCEKYANLVSTEVTNKEERTKISKIFNIHMHKYEKKYLFSKQYQTLKRLIHKGVAYHHSGLIHILKEIIEILFQQGLIKLLFATETFAVGVNMPTKTVVFTELKKPTNSKRRYLQTAEYKQMSGRAGRRGIDKTGTVIILPNYINNIPTRDDLRCIMLGKVPSISSKLSINYSLILKNILSDEICSTDFLSSSLYHKETTQIINKLTERKKYLINEINKINPEIINNDFFERYYNYQYDIQNSGFGINRKILNNLNKKMSKISNHTEKYNMYCKYKQSLIELEDVKCQIQYNINYIQEESIPLITLMKDFKYINDNQKSPMKLNSSDITIKGLLAAQINECNAFLLTEMLIQGIFIDLEPAEIAAIVAIFIDDFHPNDRYYQSDVTGTAKIHNKLKKIKAIAKKYNDKECEYNIHNGADWTIYYDYIDAVYMWATGKDIKTVLDYLGVYEGNFIRNILKINNIIQDIISLCKISKTINVIPRLDEIAPLLIKNIVTVDSLYI